MSFRQTMFAFVVLGVLFTLLFSGCGANPPEPVESLTTTDYGNGVYVIDFTNAPNNVAKFKADHPNLRITAVYAASEGGSGWTNELMIITESRDSSSER